MPNTLYVSATAGEAELLPEDALVLVTGAGTVNTAVALASYLADGEKPHPERIINIGTAGALRDGMSGIYEIHSVYQHDFNEEAISDIVGYEVPNSRQLLPITALRAASLATGDVFVQDEQTRSRLAEKADLVDMEGYVVARIGAAFDVPVTLIKQVVSNAGSQAGREWRQAVEDGAEEMRQELTKLGLI